MSVKCIIFDDEPSCIVEVSFLLGKFAPEWKILGVASDIDACKKLLEQHTPDIIFSDIHFGEQIIFDVFPELKSFRGNVVFISGDNGFASQAFELSAANYFLKPVNENQFKSFLENYGGGFNSKINQSISEVLFHNLSENKTALKKIAFNTNAGYVIKELKDVVYAKANGNYTEFNLSNNSKLIVSKTLLVYEKMLEGYGFVRIHQSYIVNFNCAMRFDSESLLLELTNGEKLPVSNRRRSDLLEMLKGIF